ncbi:MAG: hypothetical protein JW797_20420 [Bradymonadales bacterium]|nr:hypothetical protein [Bradymonadales bacterium]
MGKDRLAGLDDACDRLAELISRVPEPMPDLLVPRIQQVRQSAGEYYSVP